MTEYITLALAGIAAVLSLVCVLIRPKQGATLRDLQNLSQELQEEMRALRTEVGGTIHGTLQSTAELQANAQRQVAEAQNTRLRELSEQLAVRQTALQKAVTDQLQFIEQRMKTGALESEQKLENIRTTMETRIAAMQADNGKRLDEMRHTVDEKLQKTLDEKLQQSFSRVSEQLESVYKGLGEMQTLAQGVGDLKKVLTGVKTRGVWGEVRLRALLQDALAAGQYVENAQVTPGSSERVEFAIRLPAADGEGALLPVDSKFPQEDYLRLVEAAQAGDAEGMRAAQKQLENAVREQARRISDKYIKPPATTDYAVLFLPVESLYAEVARVDGLLEGLQNKYRVLVSGPSTFAALLTSLQMGFRTVALQKRSGEVLKLLAAVKEEFQKYGEAVQKARTRLEQASGDLDAIDTRARALTRKLRDVGEDAPALAQGDAN